MIEKQEAANWLGDFTKESTPDPSSFGYVPLPTSVQGEPEGSVYMAHLRQENTIGSMLNRRATSQLSEDVREDYDFTNYANKIPRDLISWADRFFGATTDDEFNIISGQLRQEIGDKSVLAAHPWKAAAYALDPLEPTNWLPGGFIYKEAKVAAAVGRSMLGGAIAAAGSTGLQEAVLHHNQLTRTMQESVFNTIGAGIFGGVVGGAVSGLLSKGVAGSEAAAKEFEIIQSIQKDINDTFTPQEAQSAAKNEMMDDAGIARMPKFIQETMKLTPMNRLLTSPFKVAKWFGATAFEHNYELVKNSDGKTGGVSIERSIKSEMRALNNKQIEHVNLFYEMHGVTGKYFRATRKKMAEQGTESGFNINLDQFNKAVYETALTGEDHAIPQINKAASMWRKEFDRLKDQAINLNLLPEDVSVPNAANYIMVMYNKNKIIEEGGKSARGEGTFAQHIYNQFEASNETLKQYMASPGHAIAKTAISKLENTAKKFSPDELLNIEKKTSLAESRIKSLNTQLSKLKKSKNAGKKELNALKKDIDKAISDKDFMEKSREFHETEKKRLADEIEAIEKSILDNAPQAAKTWEGKLHTVIEGNGVESTEDLIWTQVEQTIDNILGDSDGKLLNPFLSKLGGATKPFKARKLIIDQLQASPWHITDIQRISEAYNRAMVPAIKLQEFAQLQGYKDIDDFLLGVGAALRTERDQALVGKTGKAAQKIREAYDANIDDMRATIQMLQGVYGQGFNVLNKQSAVFFDNILKWNYTRMLGHMTLASLPELGLLVMRNGLMATLAQGIGESFSVVKKISKNDLRALGYGIETELGTQFKSYIEHHGLSTNPSPFTKHLDSLTRTFGNLSLMNPWTDMVQNLAGHMAINKILTVVHRSVSGGKVSNKELTNLARLGLLPENFGEIAKFTEGNIHKGTRFADWTNWDIKTPSESNALKSFQSAVSKSIDEVSIMPHFGDKPLALQQRGALGHVSRLMFQFKSYLMAATNRILYSGIQNVGDKNLYLGVVSMMGLGMLGYLASSLFRGSEPDLSPANLLREGLDRSGVLGVFGEGINIGQKLFQLGEVSRYKSRDAFGSVLGPTGGSMSDLVGLFNKLNPLSTTKGQWTTKDAEIPMRLMPMQNLFYLQRINRMLAHNIGEGLGATPVNND